MSTANSAEAASKAQNVRIYALPEKTPPPNLTHIITNTTTTRLTQMNLLAPPLPLRPHPWRPRQPRHRRHSPG
jgi:hypothetical protein